MREAAALDEEQRDEQPAQAAVALEERVDGLEALVHERALHERREAGALAEERGPTRRAPRASRAPAGARRPPSRWWSPAVRSSSGRVRNSPGVQAASRTPRSSRSCSSSTSLRAERHLRQALDAVLQRRHVVAHLAQVLAQLEVGRRRDLVEEQVDERGRRALDARREHGLLAQERRDEDLRVAPPAGEAGELAERRVRGGQALGELRRERQRGRQRRRHERRVAALGGHQVAAGRLTECRRVHGPPRSGMEAAVTAPAAARRRTRCGRARAPARRCGTALPVLGAWIIRPSPTDSPTWWMAPDALRKKTRSPARRAPRVATAVPTVAWSPASRGMVTPSAGRRGG